MYCLEIRLQQQYIAAEIDTFGLPLPCACVLTFWSYCNSSVTLLSFCCHPYCLAPKISAHPFPIFVGSQAFLPEAVNPARSLATREAARCFEEVDILLDGLRGSSSTATMMPETASSSPAVDAASDTIIASWFFCPHEKSLVQLDPAVPASYTDALTLSPLLWRTR